MGNIILPENHITFSSAPEVNEAAQPFRKLGILYVDYVRVYPDRTRLHLTTSSEWTDYFLKHHYTDICLYFEKYQGLNTDFSFSFINLWNKFNNKTVSEEISQQFNVGNGITIARQNVGFIEYFYLGADPENYKIYDLYLNNPGILNQLTFHLKEKIKNVINKAVVDRIPAPKIIVGKQEHHEDVNYNFDNLDIEQYYFYENNIRKYLSKREYECLSLAAKGKNAIEIGLILNLSQRTIERHLENVKRKFDCYKIQHLIYKALKAGIPL